MNEKLKLNTSRTTTTGSIPTIYEVSSENENDKLESPTSNIDEAISRIFNLPNP